MISTQILQSTIDGLKSITRADICILDTDGKPIAATFEIGNEYESSVLSFVESAADSQLLSGFLLFLFSFGSTDRSALICSSLTAQSFILS